MLQNQDNREHDLLDSNDYYQFQGGMLAAVESLKGEAAASYHGDHSQPDLPKIRTLKEELNRVIRSRAANPKWLEGVKRHGYKGAFEMAARERITRFSSSFRVRIFGRSGWLWSP